MTIRGKLILLTLVPLVLTVVAVIAVAVSTLHLSHEERTNAAVSEILRGTFELDYVLDGYLANRGTRERTQWELKHRSLQRLMQGIDPSDNSEKVLLDRIRSDHGKLALFFQRLVSLEQAGGYGDARERLATALLVQSRDMFSAASRLFTLRTEHLSTIYRNSAVFFVVLFAAMAAIVAAIGYSSGRNIRTAISALRRGAEEITAGNLRHRVELSGSDEFASFADAFNRMTVQVASSHGNLESMAASLKQENQERLSAQKALQDLNRELEGRIEEKTSELIKANRLLESARQHADRMAFQARLQAEETRNYQHRLEKVIDVSRHLLCAATMEDLLERVVEGVRLIIGATYCICGHGIVTDMFRIEVSSRAQEAAPCPPGRVFAIERGGVYLDIIEKKRSIRLSEEELTSHPRWWGLPEGHAPLKGLLGAPVLASDDEVIGIIMVSGKTDGDFTVEDEELLAQLAMLTSIGIENIHSRVWGGTSPATCSKDHCNL